MNQIKIENSIVEKIKEGQAEILEPPGKKVFYNPVQEFNRDLSILLLHVFFNGKKENDVNSHGDQSLRILEAFSATGLRSIRYAKEIKNVTQVIANDISDFAVENIKKNIKHNQIENLVQVKHSDAITTMFNSIEASKRFHAVDLDPYGSPAQFLDSAVQCVVDGGILLVTCTDMAILCGNFPETCYVKYGAVSLKTAPHEMAIRIVLQSIQSHASRYKRYIVPLLSVSVDFYVRIFVKIYTSAAACKNVTSNLSMVYHCTGCNAVTLQPLGLTKKQNNDKSFKHYLPYAPPIGAKCVHCSGNHHMGGPIWNGPIHDQNFVNEMLMSEKINELRTSKRLIGMLSVIREELDIPLYYNSSKLSSVLRCSNIPMMTLRSAILNGNYRVSFSHACKQSIKTDAPMEFIWDVMKQWLKESSFEPKKLTPLSAGDNILRKPVQSTIDFSLRPDANPLSREMKLTRYQENPMPFWGPGSKSTTHCSLENPKKIKNQNKKRLKKNLSDSHLPTKEIKLEDNS